MTDQLFKIHIPFKDRQKEKHISFCNADIILIDPDKLKRTTQAKDWPFCHSEVLGIPSLVVYAHLQKKPPYYFLSLFFQYDKVDGRLKVDRF